MALNTCMTLRVASDLWLIRFLYSRVISAMVWLIEGRKNTGSYPNPSSPRGLYCIIPEIDPTTDAIRTDVHSWLGYSDGLIRWLLLPSIAITHLNLAFLSAHITD